VSIEKSAGCKWFEVASDWWCELGWNRALLTMALISGASHISIVSWLLYFTKYCSDAFEIWKFFEEFWKSVNIWRSYAWARIKCPIRMFHFFARAPCILNTPAAETFVVEILLCTSELKKRTVTWPQWEKFDDIVTWELQSYHFWVLNSRITVTFQETHLCLSKNVAMEFKF